MQDILGKTAIITGASRGIGAATALELAARGIAVVLAARNIDQIQELAENIIQDGGRAQAVACDVADYASVENAVQTCINTFGGLDIFVGNAGTIDPIGALVTSNPDSWGQAADINFKGIYHGLRATLPHMQAQKFGTIINISSGAAHAPLEGWSHYCAAKAGAAMLTRAAHLEHEGDNIRVFGLSPGTVATGMQVAIKASGINPVSQLDPSVHVSPQWPAKIIAWLCTPDADAFKGQEVSLRDEDIRKRAGI
ncbi:MAG: SDR family oxidoreductase [Paracoccaceae bacterium]